MKDEFGVAGGQAHCWWSIRVHIKITATVKSCTVTLSSLVQVRVWQGRGSWIWTSSLRGCGTQNVTRGPLVVWTCIYSKQLAINSSLLQWTWWFGVLGQVPLATFPLEAEEKSNNNLNRKFLCTEMCPCRLNTVSIEWCTYNVSQFLHMLGFSPWKHFNGASWFPSSGLQSFQGRGLLVNSTFVPSVIMAPKNTHNIQ